MASIRTMYNWNWLKAHDAFKRCRDKRFGAVVAKHSHIREWGKDADGNAIYAASYWNTSLVRWYANGRVEVSSQGWHSMTTKRRMYQFAGVSMNRIKGHHILRDTSGNSTTAVLDNGQWFTLRTDEGEWGLRETGRNLMRGTIHPMRKPSTAKRDPIKKMCRGDILISPEGQHFLCVGRRAGETRVMDLVQYFGDPALGLVRLGWDKMIEVTDLMQLTLPMSGWKAGQRFESAV